MKVITISSVEGFNKYFKEFKEDALINNNPYIYHIGLDTEYINSSNFPENYKNIKGQDDNTKIKLCTIQICSQNICLILRVCDMLVIPISFVDILTSSNWIKTGVGIDLDIYYCLSNFEIESKRPTSYIDLKIFGFLEGEKNPNFENLVSKKFKKYKKSSTSVHDWFLPLNEKTRNYVFEDAYYSYVLGRQYIPCYDGKISIFPEEIEFIEDKTEENYINRLQEYTVRKFQKLPNYKKNDKVFFCSIEKNEISDTNKNLCSKNLLMKLLE